MDRITRAELLERIRLLDQAAKDFPGTDVTLECHHLINDVATLAGDDSDLLLELARATNAAIQGKTAVVCVILQAVLSKLTV